MAKVISDALWAISTFSATSRARVDRIIEEGTVPYIMRYITHDHSQVYYPAVRIIGDIACLGEKQTSVLLSLGILDVA